MRNLRKLVSTKSNGDELNCIHGIRFVTMVWIIIGHTLEWNNLNIFSKSNQCSSRPFHHSMLRSGDNFAIRDKLASLDMQPIFKAHYSVETFFYISGLLTSYIIIKFTNGDYGNFSYSSFLSLRYLRLTPQLGLFLIFSSLVPGAFDGPLWHSYIGGIADRCYQTWWHNIVYLHNFIDIQNIVSSRASLVCKE